MTDMPVIHHYDPATGDYLRASVADQDPLDKDRSLIPFGATLDPPPGPRDGFVRRYADGAWGYAPEGDVAAAPTPDPVVTSAMVNSLRDAIIATGTTITVDGYGPIPLQGREKDQTNLLGLMSAAKIRIDAGDVTTLRKFRDANNVNHMLTPPQFVELWAKGSAWISDVYEASWDLKDMDPIPLDFTDSQYWP